MFIPYQCQKETSLLLASLVSGPTNRTSQSDERKAVVLIPSHNNCFSTLLQSAVCRSLYKVTLKNGNKPRQLRCHMELTYDFLMNTHSYNIITVEIHFSDVSYVLPPSTSPATTNNCSCGEESPISACASSSPGFSGVTAGL